ncbi:histone-like nucleoid-structuring protein Lsr2 [Yinghuangia seranimata]|uniref:histone-like nucleoid-structuring protein Lsr2 n=1 Tax=Yinghuangia seranimata TaxID=408067 RepID=UPI00248C98FB|nr:Lsr2 family protein [Yinghuangia seranimata]MDI2132957.1 Lsr2 family protein [Yinghuangia seranimata]
MAQKVQILLVDDLDGGKADETVTFALDGVSYEIDLSEANAGDLRTALATYVDVARKTGGRAAGRRAARGAAKASGSGADTAEIRKWAKENGHEVSERGRVPAKVKEAYDKAHA